MDKKRLVALLKDPRWQKKRLEILQRDNFTCQCCGSKTKELQIHHLYYDKNLKPWEYSNEALVTMCLDCHEYETDTSRGLYQTYKETVDTMRKAGWSACVIDAMFSQLQSFATQSEDYCDGAKEFLTNVVYGTQSLFEVKKLMSMGVDVSDFLEHNPEIKSHIKAFCNEK